MDKSVIEWTHGKLNESKKNQPIGKKYLVKSESLYFRSFSILVSFPDPNKNHNTFLLKVEEFVRICKSQRSISSIGNPITLVLEPENFSMIKSARVCNP